VKIIGVGARSLACNTFRVRGVCYNSEMGTRICDKNISYSYEFVQTKQEFG